jgi:hypothetical protein
MARGRRWTASDGWRPRKGSRARTHPHALLAGPPCVRIIRRVLHARGHLQLRARTLGPVGCRAPIGPARACPGGLRHQSALSARAESALVRYRGWAFAVLGRARAHRLKAGRARGAVREGFTLDPTTRPRIGPGGARVRGLLLSLDACLLPGAPYRYIDGRDRVPTRDRVLRPLPRCAQPRRREGRGHMVLQQGLRRGSASRQPTPLFCGAGGASLQPTTSVLSRTPAEGAPLHEARHLA